MILLAVRNLITERTRFAFSAAGIGFAVFLITILLGLYQGWNNRIGAFVEDVATDGWVVREGTTDFMYAASILPEDMRAQAERHEGVAAVHPIIVRPMAFFRPDGTRVETQLIGYDVASGVGGPPDIVRGRGEPGPGEIVVDEVLSRISGVGIGDTLISGENTFEIIGLASGGNFASTQASFVDVTEAAALLELGGAVTFWLVTLEEGAPFESFRSEFQAQSPGISVFSSEEFASATRHRILDNVTPILALIVGLAFVVGIAITSLTIYTATVERAREFGVMKAVGFNNMDLYRLVLIQSMLTGVLGFIFGVALTLVMSRFVDRIVAQFIVLVRPQDVAFVLVATVVMAAAAAIVPAKRVGSVDPAVAFKG